MLVQVNTYWFVLEGSKIPPSLTPCKPSLNTNYPQTLKNISCYVLFYSVPLIILTDDIHASTSSSVCCFLVVSQQYLNILSFKTLLDRWRCYWREGQPGDWADHCKRYWPDYPGRFSAPWSEDLSVWTSCPPPPSPLSFGTPGQSTLIN